MSISATVSRQGTPHATLPAVEVASEECSGPPSLSKSAVLTPCKPSAPPAFRLSDEDTPIGELKAEGFTKGSRVKKTLKGALDETAARCEDAGAQRPTAGGGKQGLVLESDSSQGDKSALETQGQGSWATAVDSMQGLPEGSFNQQSRRQVGAAPVGNEQPQKLRFVIELYGTEGGPSSVSEGIEKRSKRPSRAVSCFEKGVRKRQKEQKVEVGARIEGSEVIDLRGL